MKGLHSYLTFNGNCREAMNFYKECIGGKLNFQTVGESPLAGKMPQQMKDCILHCTLKNAAVVLMASDITQKNGLNIGNNISLMLDCKSEKQIKTCYQKLLIGGSSNHPLEETHWGAIFGDLTDKYGNHWLFNYRKQK